MRRKTRPGYSHARLDIPGDPLLRPPIFLVAYPPQQWTSTRIEGAAVVDVMDVARVLHDGMDVVASLAVRQMARLTSAAHDEIPASKEFVFVCEFSVRADSLKDIRFSGSNGTGDGFVESDDNGAIVEHVVVTVRALMFVDHAHSCTALVRDGRIGVIYRCYRVRTVWGQPSLKSLQSC